MKRTRAQQKAELMAQADRLIDQLLDWEGETPAPNWTQIEEAVLKFRDGLGQQAAHVLLSGQEAQQPGVEPTCPTCQGKLRYKGRKPLQVETQLGSLEMERGYYYCPTCQAGIFPPG